MSTEKKRFWLEFSTELVTSPIVYQLVKQFDLIPDIRQASIGPETGIMSLELEGEREKINEAIVWMESEGVKVDPVEINVIEG